MSLGNPLKSEAQPKEKYSDSWDNLHMLKGLAENTCIQLSSIIQQISEIAVIFRYKNAVL